MHHRTRLVYLLALIPVLALAQFQWQDDGLPIRQGAHLGWNGAAVCAGNDVALFYYDCLRDGTRDVWGTRIAPDGEHIWGQNGRLVAGDISEQRAPIVAAYADGSILAVWEDYSVGRFRDLKAQRYDHNGNAMWSPSEGVSVVQTFRDQFDAKLAIDESGYAYVIFNDDRLTEGADTRLNVYGQVLSPSGERIGPIDGIQLLFSADYNNQPVDIVCVGNSAYALCTEPSAESDLVIQKISESGQLGFADENSVAEYSDFGTHKMVAIENGLAVAWTALGAGQQYGDARVVLLDTTRAPLSGWTADGILIASGPDAQTIANLTAAPDGGVIVAVADFEFDPEESSVLLYHYSRTGELTWGPVDLGIAALRTSPLDWAWDGTDLIVTWAEFDESYNNNLRTQKISSTGTKLWGNDGNLVWTRLDKKLRAEIEQPPTGAARLVVVSGRAIAQPESLFVAELNDSGQLAGAAEFVSGGWTYDSYDQETAKLDNWKFGVIWTDNRASLNRDVYFQIVDGNGETYLEPNGRKLNSDHSFLIHLPPEIAADGNGGAFLVWAGDSIGFNSVMHIHRIDNSGAEVWANPVRIRSVLGFLGQPHVVADGSGGAFVAFSRFNDSFVARISIAHIDAAGNLSWPEVYHEFPGLPGADLILTDAESDGHGGCYLSGVTGQWQDTQAIVYHINADGSFGDGWSDAGREYGAVGRRDRNSKLMRLGENILLTYEQPQSDDAATYDVRGVLVTLSGQDLWGTQGHRISGPEAAAVRHDISPDGQGGFLVSYEDFRDGVHSYGYVARYDADGIAEWSGVDRRVCTHEGDQSFMTVTHDGNGGAWVMWEDYRNTDIYSEIDLYGTHIDGDGNFASIGGFEWPSEGYPICDVPTYQQAPVLIPWNEGSALAVWKDLRSSNPGRCCGAGAVGDIFNNIYAQILTEVTLAADENVADILHPSSFILSAYPNPFNPNTTLNFTLSQNANVKLTIYNVLGQATESILDAPLLAGDYAFDWNAGHLPSGIYFAKLETSTGLSTVTKLTLLK